MEEGGAAPDQRIRIGERRPEERHGAVALGRRHVCRRRRELQGPQERPADVRGRIARERLETAQDLGGAREGAHRDRRGGPHRRLVRCDEEADERLPLPRPVGFHREDGARAHTGRQLAPGGEREQEPTHLRGSDLGEHLQDGARVVVEEDQRLGQYGGRRQCPEAPREERAHGAVAFGQGHEDPLSRVAALLGLPGARRQRRGHAQLGIFVPAEPAQRRQDLVPTDRREVPGGREQDLARRVRLEPRDRRLRAERSVDLGQRRQRERGLLGRPGDPLDEPARGRHRAHPTQRRDGRATDRRHRVLDEEPRGQRGLEPGEPEPAGRADGRGDVVGLRVTEPRVHERQQPHVAEAPAHRAEQGAALRGRVDVPGDLEERPRRLLRDLPGRPERAAREIPHEPEGLDPHRAARRLPDQRAELGERHLGL